MEDVMFLEFGIYPTLVQKELEEALFTNKRFMLNLML